MRIGRVVAAVAAWGALSSCGAREQHAGGDSGQTQAPAPAAPRYGLGTVATPAEISALDIDVSPSGEGLPPGRGDVASGERLYRAQCAVCHGASGEGIAPNPPLIGRDPRSGFPFATNAALKHTIGNYWPYATSLFDYVRRTMPLLTPGTLSNDETYSLTAFLLAANGILAAGTTLDSASLVAVRMPAHDRFVPDNRRGGREIR